MKIFVIIYEETLEFELQVINLTELITIQLIYRCALYDVSTYLKHHLFIMCKNIFWMIDYQFL